MNIRAGSMPTRSSRTAHRRNASGGAGRLWTVGYLVMLLACAFGILNYRILLNQRLDAVQRETERVKREINELGLEIKVLEMRKESLHDWRYINAKITEYNLQLRKPDPAQIRRLAITRRTGVNGRTMTADNRGENDGAAARLAQRQR